jgi:hypothetical protein
MSQHFQLILQFVREQMVTCMRLIFTLCVKEISKTARIFTKQTMVMIYREEGGRKWAKKRGAKIITSVCLDR